MAIQVNSAESRPHCLEDDHPLKRARRELDNTKTQHGHDLLTSSAFSSSDFLDSHKSSALKLQHDQSRPYLHAILKDVFDTQLLRQARDEIIDALSFTLKETDIYKVLQTGDLKNLDGLPTAESQKLHHVKMVRDALYSQKFRDFLHQVTSCGPLSGKQTDMSINNYRQGCHLLNHDDVIGTRRVSYILYLTDPEIPWEAEDGGALELYPVDPQTHQPLPTPSTKILPSWNQFVFFVVQPGRSFHSVEEVFNLKKNRLSISGWFHLPHEDETGYSAGLRIKQEEEKKLQSLGASLDQLKGMCCDNSGWVDVAVQLPDENSSSLTPDELNYLSQYIDRSYLKIEDISRLQERFVRDSHLSLIGFLEYRFSSQLKQAILEIEANDWLTLVRTPPESPLYTKQFYGPKFELGLHDENWEIVGPPHKHRYLRLSSGNTSNKSLAVSNLLNLKNLFQSEAFAKWIQLITTCNPTSHQVTPRRFRPGLDYTLATANNSQLLELHLSLTPSLGWDDGELGGYECYMTSSDEDQADPAVYKAPDSTGENDDRDDSALLTIYPTWNQLDLVLRDPQVLTFTKYVSFKSPQSKWDIKAEYKIRDDDEDDES